MEALDVVDSDALWKTSEEAVREACQTYRYAAIWNEITRMLEGLGYDVSKRQRRSHWW